VLEALESAPLPGSRSGRAAARQLGAGETSGFEARVLAASGQARRQALRGLTLGGAKARVSNSRTKRRREGMDL
jgi:hypothetical protein